MPRWNNTKCGFQKGNNANPNRMKFGKGNTVNIGRIPWNKGMKFPNRPRKPKRKCQDCSKDIHRSSVLCLSCSKKLKYRNHAVRQKRWGKKINGIYIQNLSPRIRDLKEYSQWRIDVFKRDGFVCQICNERGKLLHAHHIKKMSEIFIEKEIDSIEKSIQCEMLWDLNNGVTLCVPCHKNVHANIV